MQLLSIPTSAPIRVGLSGKMRSGKDSAAHYLQAHYGIEQYAFADRMKELAIDLFGMKPGRKDRRLLVEFSRKMLELDRMVWVNYVLREIPIKSDVCVSDVRYQHEYHALKAFGFVLVRVECDEETRLERVKTRGSAVDLALLEDQSETDLDSVLFDFVLDGSSFESLYEGADVVMQSLGRVKDA